MQFEKVFFKYHKSERYILKNINFKIHKGEKIALVGHSGAGKTTLLNLLPRFFDPLKGKIKLGGIDLKDFSLSFIRDHFSLVSQDIVLFDETVKYNIAYGTKNTNHLLLQDACKKANCDEFIKKLPNGMNEIIGPIYYVFATDSRHEWEEYAEAECFFCFTNL